MTENANSSPKQYTYIIAGGGMAGLSLASYLAESNLPFESVLVIDLGVDHPKSWSYWSDQNHSFDSFAEHQWKELQVHTFQNKCMDLSISPFVYRKIDSQHWSKSVREQIQKHPKFEFLQAKIESFQYEGKHTQVKTDLGIFEATQKIFDSISPYPCDLSNPKDLKQHFVGLSIETNFPLFDPSKVILFDFRIAFTKACEFMYVLPTSSKVALFEHTFFSGELLKEEEYLEKIKAYLLAYYGLGEDDYRIVGTEKGIIPMNYLDIPQNLHQKHIKIGTSGGFVKASTGYSFFRTQHFLKALVQNLEKGQYDSPLVLKNQFKVLLDRILIQVLIDQEIKGSRVFELLFQKNSAQKMLRFLDEKTSIWEDLTLMWTVPTWTFMKAFFKIAFKGKSFSK